MRNIFVLLMSLAVTCIKCQLDCTFADNCNAEGAGHNIAHYTCVPGDGGNPADVCTCKGTNCKPSDQITSTFDNIDCEKICTDETLCKFYKFTEGGGMIASKNCYLMDKDQCNGYVECDPDHGCTSAGTECDGNQPQQYSCPVNVDWDTTDSKLHWSCISMHDGKPSNIYDESVTEVPTGTVCTAQHSCFRYPDDARIDYTLQYSCEDKADGSAGEWKSKRGDNSKYDANVLGDSKLIEPDCLPDSLTISKYPAQKGEMVVTCTNTEIDANTGEVTAPNECVVLCDFYPIIRFYPGWGDDVTGERVWKYDGLIEDVDVDAGENFIVDGDKVSCY